LPEIVAARSVVLEEFLAPAELDALLRYTLEREREFHVSEVVSPGIDGGARDFEHRRSRVLQEMGRYGEELLDKILRCLPSILPQLGMEDFPVRRVETQITASNDGDFFRWHCDNSQPEVASRELTFVYFFHQEPARFEGGELRIYDGRLENGYLAPARSYHAIVPQQNQIVFFPSSLPHEITRVECPGRAFAHSRFTVNGWLHR
jgi:Rps23 Pro-64 3,4-dihydroxylase Tpa1-like proline 4-hydroxylase